MNSPTLRTLEFDRIVAAVADLAVTPTGQERLLELEPLPDVTRVIAAQKATSEGTRFLADYPGFPLRAPSDLESILDALGVEGRPLEAVRLLALADYLESIEHSRTAVRNATTMFPILRELVERVASFKAEIADVRKKIDPSGEVNDHASAALAGIRERLRRQRAKLRTTLESFLRGRDTAKYLQEQVVTDRNGRYVLVVRSEHRSAIPGIVHGASASGASLYLEPLATVEINNDIVALEEQEAEEVRRILLVLTDQFRARPEDLRRTIEVATELDVIQARARFSLKVGGSEPAISIDGTFELRGARHPLLIPGVGNRPSTDSGRPEALEGRESGVEQSEPVPNDILIIPPTRVMVITGPNTGGKTVALKTAGLLALMAQAGLHIPAEQSSRVPVFRCVFADIGDEQSISASLSTFSAHIANVVSMDRNLTLPALVLLDEVGAGTDPVEGGALGIAVIDHFRKRGAHLIATTHYDALKSYASTTDGVTSAAFGFDPDSFAPTYRLVYGSPGRSLAIEIAARLGVPPPVIAAARENLSEEQKQLADHLARVDKELRAIEQQRRELSNQRAALAESEKKLRGREVSVREREETFRRRLDTKIDDQLREARREIDKVIEELRNRAPRLVNTGETGAARSDARASIDQIVGRIGTKTEGPPKAAPYLTEEPAGPIEAGSRVVVGGLGLEGTVVELRGSDAEIDVRGKRMRAKVRDLRALGGTPASARVNVNVDLQPREGSLSDLNVIGQTVDEAIARLEKFLDESTLTDQRTIRIVHGHGTGQLRRAIAAFLKNHPLVAHYELAPQKEGGGGATIVELKD
ncbi:MAG TPA: endonuclease MutS2 [Vicinamibacterales bacterium]|nr:endonuclease MutS2 [Vicinamibacterales bacterium]